MRIASRFTACLSCAVLIVFAIGTSVAQELDVISNDDFLAGSHPRTAAIAPRGHQNGQAHARFGIFGIDSLANFNGHYFVDGFDSNGNPNNHWYFNTVGNPPQLGGTTLINAPVVPVAVDLRDANGNPRFNGTNRLLSDPTPFVAPTINSPVFQNFSYMSSDVPTQFTDAVQRAEYFNRAKSDWHTLLVPSVKTMRTMAINQDPNCGQMVGNPPKPGHCNYQFALNANGTCCRFILADIDVFANLLFPATDADTTTPVGAAEHAGEMTTKDMSSFLFPNTFLYFGTRANCCVLGFHTFDVEPGDASNGNQFKLYVTDYSSWISPGLFGNSFTDITALSHEIAEAYNDPFVAAIGTNNITPWWKAPNGLCQNNLETGDVIEGLAKATFPITMNGFTYHPQNEALLQWFEFQQPSDALGGAYSYPDTTVLTGPSAPQKANCAQ
ncbi:MAG TPA: hypothetical protein VNX88_01965 [Terriglobales bacterium]|jgi:hypothetical protein|nr:hypothetical protein [Terriglobales bacterium]